MNIYNFIKSHKKHYYIIIIATVVILGIILTKYRYIGFIEKFGDCPSSDNPGDMPEDAAEACKRISSKAEEIEAHYGGSDKLLQNMPFVSLFNPNNYRSGDNSTNDMARNIINTSMSECEIQSISNSCSNSIGSSQINIIDQTACYICTHVNPKLCSIKGIVQRNNSELTSTCNMKAAIAILSSKKNSVDAQALAKVLQKADGIMSGDNTTRTENCNIIDSGMSSSSYIEQKSTCINSLDLSQSNILKGCYVSEAIQENHSKKLAECMLNTELTKDTKIETTTNVENTFELDQEAEGINAAASIISGIVSMIFSSMALVFLYFFSQQEI